MSTQQILAAPARAGIFLTLTINESHEAEVAEVLKDVSSLTRAVSFRIPDAQLICVVGIGAHAWPRLFKAPAPAKLHPFPEIAGDKYTAVSTPGDLLIHLRGRSADVCFELANQLMRRLGPHCKIQDEVHGFKFFDERDLLGFVDGKPRKIIRDNMPFGSFGDREFGTYFIGYAADPAVTEQMLRNMFVGNPPGNYDRILDFSTVHTGALFFAPPVEFLDDPSSAS